MALERGCEKRNRCGRLQENLPDSGVDFNLMVDQFETKLITMALLRTHGNKKAAAKLLRLNRTTLVEKIKKKGLEQKIEVSVDSSESAFRPLDLETDQEVVA